MINWKRYTTRNIKIVSAIKIFGWQSYIIRNLKTKHCNWALRQKLQNDNIASTLKTLNFIDMDIMDMDPYRNEQTRVLARYPLELVVLENVGINVRTRNIVVCGCLNRYSNAFLIDLAS